MAAITIAFPALEAKLDEILQTEKAILKVLRDVHRAARLAFIDPVTSKEISMALQLTDIQKTTLHVVALDARNNPATLDTPPTWSVSDATVISLTVAPDGLSADIAAVGPDGNSQVNVQAVVGGNTIAGSLDVTVISSAATTLQISADKAVDQ